MNRRLLLSLSPALLAAVALVGCFGTTSTSSANKPTFSLAWSEYPSWSVFGVAHEKNLINGDRGNLGPIEEKWGVDIELKQADYDPCLQMFGASTCDAVCITNMDALAPSLRRKSVAILPTSTSAGADACVVIGINDLQELRKQKTYGLEKSVSEYCFYRVLEKKGEKEADYPFVNMDPGEAAKAMQTNPADHKSIMVWNPFVMQTLKTRKDSKVLFSSKEIPGEIIDMVVVARDSLGKPGGKEFAHAVIDTFYEVNKMLADPKTADDTLVALGAKFSSLGLDEMKEVVEQTKFYKTPQDGIGVFNDKQLPETMKTVMAFCTKRGIVDKEPKLAFGGKGDDANLHFDPTYIEAVQKKQK